ncbi:hypothetical protein GGI21_000599 [Coemansia aciculifera]|nr:hypothetical protein GGI21_000599 [Coemansia aciculifera]
MATYSSYFQTLPALIVHKVVEYLEGRRGNSFGADMTKHNKGKAVLAPLLSVGSHWSAVAFASICDSCSVKFDYTPKAIRIAYPAWPTDIPRRRLRKNHLVKWVVVSVPPWSDMCNGKFCDVLSRPEFEGVEFLSATTLELYLTKDVVNVPTSTPAHVITKEQVADFVCSVRSLTPAATGVIITCESFNKTLANAKDLYHVLLTELYQVGTAHMEIYSTTGRLTSFSMTMPAGLTSVVQGDGMKCSKFAQIAYCNSRTLKCLDIRPRTEDDWRNLLYMGTKDLVKFECLKSLKMHISDSSYTTSWAAVADIAPFPVLSTLDVSGGYPFDDDVLFRDNGQTMQSIRLPFSALARNALGRFNILRRKGAGRLNAVHIGAVSDVDDTFVAGLSAVPIENQIHSILDVAATLAVKGDTEDLPLVRAVTNAPSISVLRHLKLGQFILSLSGVIDIVSAIPSLVNLACRLDEPQLTAMTSSDSKSPGNLRAKHYPLSEDLRTIHVHYTLTATGDNLAKIAMLIAILCPKLVHVDIPPKLRNPFSREIGWGMKNRPFAFYSGSISRLMYKG